MIALFFWAFSLNILVLSSVFYWFLRPSYYKSHSLDGLLKAPQVARDETARWWLFSLHLLRLFAPTPRFYFFKFLKPTSTTVARISPWRYLPSAESSPVVLMSSSLKLLIFFMTVDNVADCWSTWIFSSSLPIMTSIASFNYAKLVVSPRFFFIIAGPSKPKQDLVSL